MFEPLTEREQEILLLLSRGMTNREIALHLFLSQGTIKAHNHNIFSKLGVSTRTQALLRAQELNLLTPDTFPNDSTLAPISDANVPNLPLQLTPFIGRENEINKLNELLSDARVRLITITGTGGIGKTRLAIETARMQVDHFGDGIFFVPLAPTLEAQNIPAAILDALGIRLQSSEHVAQQLFAYLRDKRILLVLDNYEHLLEAADFIAALLQASADLKVIVTSRERLQLSAEVLYVLGGLDYDMGKAEAEPMAFSAVQLLVQRARFVNPEYELHPHEWNSIRRICQLTEGMPLALILAAGWLEMLTLEEIVVEMTHSIDILESQLRDLPIRQRSMRMTIAASWNRLTQDEQCIFANLSIFRGGFSREAAFQVTGANLRELQTLVNRSFITVSEGRYEIHELLRQYGEEVLQQSSYTVDVCTAHSAYYLDFLYQREPDVKGRRQRSALEEIQVDFENIRTAWEWAVAHRHLDAIHQAIDCLTNFAAMQVYLVRVEDIFRRTTAALAPTGGENPHPVWDQVALRHEQTRQRLSLPANMHLMESILERARTRLDEHEVAYTLWVMGNQALLERNLVLHHTVMEESLAIWRALGNEFYIAHVLAGFSGYDMSSEATAEAIPHLLESAAIRRRLGDTHELSFTLMMAGIRLAYQGTLAASEVYFDECMSLQHGFDRTPDFAGIVSMKGILAFWRGDFEKAGYYANLGLDFSQEMNYYGDKSCCQALLALVLSMRGNYQQAIELCQEASQGVLFDVSAMGVHWGLALAHAALRDATAWQSLKDSLHVAWRNLRSPVFQICLLPVAAILAANEAHSHAVELLALAFQHPPEITGWMHKWHLLTKLRRELEMQLGADEFAAAWQRGLTLELEPVIAQLLEGHLR